jgi:hypothetical protein
VAPHQLGRSRREVGHRENLARWGYVIRGTAEQVERHGQLGEIHSAASDAQLALDQLVVAKQMPDDPQIKRARDVLGVLEPVLELLVTVQVVGVAHVEQ